jgi:cell wall-associated NlpC family hydrolase
MITQPARKICIFALTITLLGAIAGCASQPQDERVSKPPSATERQPRVLARPRPAGVGQRAATAALQQVGVPYRYGGSSSSGFDCSGLVQFSYARAGKNVARTTRQLWSTTRSVRRADLRVGDLLFFNFEGKMSHVGLYIGEQRFVHAPSSGRKVSIASLTSPVYAKAFVRAARPK